MKTDKQLVQECNILAGEFYKVLGYQSPKKHLFYKTTHPHEKQVWYMACIAFELLKQTDIQNIIDCEDENDD